MFVRKANSKWIVRTPAKLNLYLSLRGRRADGYHELETLMAPIGLFDTLILSAVREVPTGPSVRFNLRWAGQGSSSAAALDVPHDGSNLVVRAIDALRRHTGCEAGADVTLVKRIPTGAGLGGGSSDAAAALVAANAAWGLHLSLPQLTEIAASLGSDVPFFLANRAALCTGRGDVVKPIQHRTRLHAILVTPDERLASRDVYAAVQHEDFRRGDCQDGARRRRLIEAFGSGDVGSLSRLMFNALQRAALSLAPGLAKVNAALGSYFGGQPLMTGSGSSCFCLCRSARHARRGAAYLRSNGLTSAMTVVTCG